MAGSSRDSARGQVLGGWLSGPGARPDGSTGGTPRLALPASGPGSRAGTARRLGGIVVDWLLAELVARAFVRPTVHNQNTVQLVTTLVFVVVVLVGQATAGRTPGMAVFRTRLVTTALTHPRLRWVAFRTLLLVVPPLVLALVTDADGRGLHDKAAGTVVVRA